MADKIYDVAIVGSGPAGYTAAIRAGQFGLKTALIEKDNVLGGTCLHVGCIPTKALLFNAEIYDHLKDAAEFGIEGLGTPKLNWPKIQDRKDKIVTKHTKGLDFLMRKNKVDVIRGYGKLTGPAKNGVVTVDVENGGAKSQVQAKNVLLASGSEARMISGLKPDDRILTNIEILSLKDIPKSLIVVGSGAVGVEFASIYNSFGTKVTVVEMLPRIVPVEDEEVSKELARSLSQARDRRADQRGREQSGEDEGRRCRRGRSGRKDAAIGSRQSSDRDRPPSANRKPWAGKDESPDRAGICSGE